MKYTTPTIKLIKLTSDALGGENCNAVMANFSEYTCPIIVSGMDDTILTQDIDCDTYSTATNTICYHQLNGENFVFGS